MERTNLDENHVDQPYLPILMHPTPEESKGKIVGAEELKDAGILTSRPEYDEDGLEITNVDKDRPYH